MEEPIGDLAAPAAQMGQAAGRMGEGLAVRMEKSLVERVQKATVGRMEEDLVGRG